MPSGRKIICGVMVGLLLAALLCTAGLLAARHYLPEYLTALVTARLEQFSGMPVHLRVRSAWLHGAELSSMRLGSARQPALQIDSLRLDYAPLALYRKGRIDRVVVRGLQVFAALRGGRLRLKDRKLRELLSAGTGVEKESTKGKGAHFSAAIRRLDVDGMLWVDGLADSPEAIPFTLQITGIANGMDHMTATARLLPRGQEVNLSAHMTGRQLKVELDIPGLAMGAFNGLRILPGDLSLDGLLSLSAGMYVNLKRARISDLAARCRVENLRVQAGRLRLRNPSKADPFLLQLTAPDAYRWGGTLSGLCIQAPFPLKLASLTMELDGLHGAWKGKGYMQAVLFPKNAACSPVIEGLRVDTPIPLPIEISGVCSGRRDWRISVVTTDSGQGPAAPLALHYRGLGLRAGAPALRFSAEGDKDGVRTQLTATIDGIGMRAQGISSEASSLALESRVRLRHFVQPLVEGSAEMLLDNAVLKSTPAVAGAEKVRGRVAFSRKASGEVSASGILAISGGRAETRDRKLRVSGVSVNLPLRWPLPDRYRPGEFASGSVLFRGRPLGRLKGRLVQRGAGLDFSAVFRTALVSQLKTSLKGRFQWRPEGHGDLRLKLNLKRPATAPEIDLGTLEPAAAGWFAGGALQVQGEFRDGGRGISGQLTASWQDGRLRMPEKKIRIGGIRARVRLPRLPELRSAPAQPIDFKRADVGNLVLENGHVEWGLESPRSVLIEKSRLRWCRGIVEVPAFRIAPQTEDYRLTLYCDRLNLARVLDQLGIDAQGEGTLNGRIPVHWSRGRIDFADGFLFSTPGEGGKIRLMQSDVLTAGVAPGTAQYDQMALASEALKDYDYRWARLTLNTEGDDLLMRLQLDGRPAGVLPFEYRREKGGFVKVPKGARGSRFQGIRLDVNFRLPLNRLLRYSDILPMMQ